MKFSPARWTGRLDVKRARAGGWYGLSIGVQFWCAEMVEEHNDNDC